MSCKKKQKIQNKINLFLNTKDDKYFKKSYTTCRYNMERMSNDMNRVVRLTNWRAPIEEGYFPKLDNILANRVWPPRHVNSILSVIY